MSDLNEKNCVDAFGNCSDIPVSPEEDAEICAAAHAENFQSPMQTATLEKGQPYRAPAPKSMSLKPKSYSP